MRIVAIVVITIAVGCTHPTSSHPALDEISQWVTGDALSSLDANGRFIFPPLDVVEGVPITTSREATDLSHAFIELIRDPHGGRIFRDQLNQQRGSAIRYEALEYSGRAYFAASPYNLPLDSIPNWVRKSLGPFFLVPFIEGGRPVIVVATSAFNTDIQIEDGHLVFPSAYGNDFFVVAVPAGEDYVMPITAERAVEVVWRATHIRVSQVPELIAPRKSYYPHFARWHISLEDSVFVEGRNSGRQYKTADLYVGYGGRHEYDQLMVALHDQPTVETIAFPSPSGEHQEIVLGIRENVPVSFEPANVLQ